MGSRELLVLVLSAGMAGAELAATIEKLKSSSKSCGSHKRRQLLWDAYTKMAVKANGIDAGTYAFLKYSADTKEDNPDGVAEIVELTKRQKGLVSGGSVEIMGPKFKPPDDAASKSFCFAWGEEAAQTAWSDLMFGEPCVYITPDSVFVGTRHKRALCKSTGAPLKTAKDVEKFVAELKPNAPLRTVSFAGNEPPTVNEYNVILAGAFKLDAALPSSVGHINTTSCDEIYDYFLRRKNDDLVAQANKLIAQMLADVGKGLTPIISAASTKEAAIAYKSGLMKRVFVHESMKKFIDRARADGSVELNVITGDDDAKLGDFAAYGKICFEMFYRVDLSTMGA
mmetsp:Transcript_15216/g.40844  ORF Transcript_15216/g.40844 Transcript_15216/m.40844 type:complete len:340 (+) Transcript_15216:125-1144(+)